LLWYVEQAVPDPNCNTVASTACPTVNALVPQVYLPEGYAQALTKPTGGTIAGDNVSLDINTQPHNKSQWFTAPPDKPTATTHHAHPAPAMRSHG
jgi:hypothetical protein